ncbi:hypothetical protein Tco_1184667 [Tanacetum coccineum]
MSLSTISSESMDESIGSSASYVILSDFDAASAMAKAVIAAPPAGVLDPTLVVDYDYEPFEDPSSPVDTLVLDSDAEPLGSPATSNYLCSGEIGEVVKTSSHGARVVGLIGYGESSGVRIGLVTGELSGVCGGISNGVEGGVVM